MKIKLNANSNRPGLVEALCVAITIINGKLLISFTEIRDNINTGFLIYNSINFIIIESTIINNDMKGQFTFKIENIYLEIHLKKYKRVLEA